MAGSRSQERENRKVIFGFRSREHVEVVSEIVAVPVGIPADVTVRLVVDAIASTIVDTLFPTITGAGFPLSCPGINGSSISGDSQILKVDQSLVNGSIQELGSEDIKETFSRSEIMRRFDLQFGQEFIDCHFFNRICLLALLFWLFGFSFGGWSGSERLFWSDSHRRRVKS